MFEIKNVSKKFGGEFALRDISMTIGKGLNFIIGASGSGKTTLLKIISGMEQEFDGEVFYCGQSIKALTDTEKSYYYNNIFGFVWQDFNLLDDRTVLENVMLSQYLKDGIYEADKKEVMKALRELKISELAYQKVGKLSGGQKQRVAIARELIKNPQVIIADEPTSALDEKSTKITMDILRDIAKSRIVIVVTHDRSLIDVKAKVYELDKAELVSSPENVTAKAVKQGEKLTHKLSLSNAFSLAAISSKSKLGRSIITAISLLVAATLLLITVSGAITNGSQAAFDVLYDTYGKGILDISIVQSFMSGAGTSGNDTDESNADVDQDINGLYDKYLVDERVEHIVFTQAYDGIKVIVDDKEYDVESSGSVPVVNELTVGEMPMGSGNEVVVPDSFVKKLGLTEKDAIGKTIDFKATVYNWESGEPVKMPVTTTAKIVGVVDTSATYENDGEIFEYTVDDSFFFSKAALTEMRKQAKIEKSESGFSIRTKSPEDLIAIKDELNSQGIVPLGRFELVEDMVRLNDQTTKQSGSAMIVIGILSVITVIAVAMITAFMRKREYAIYMVSGYSRRHIILMMTSEAIIMAFSSALLFLITSPVSNIITKAAWGVNILNGKLLGAGVLLVLATGVLSGIISSAVSSSTKAVDSLKTGDR